MFFFHLGGFKNCQKLGGGCMGGGGSPCRMSIIRNVNVALSILRNSFVALSILRKSTVALLILRKCRVACR